MDTVFDGFEVQIEQLSLQEPQSAKSRCILNDLVLDSICKYLPVKDLKNLRLVSRQVHQAASRSLAKKTIVCLTSKTLAGDEASFVNSKYLFPPSPGTRCKCWSDLEKRRYFSVDHEGFPHEPISNNGFRPRKLALLGCAVAYKLSPEQFGRVEELEVTRYNQASGMKLLRNVAILFPNLKSLTFRQIQPHSWIKYYKCNCAFCNQFTHQNILLGGGRIITLDEEESTGTSEPYDSSPLSAEQRSSASKLPLVKLSYEASPHSAKYDWEICKYFGKLQVLEINACGQQWLHGEIPEDLLIKYSLQEIGSYVDCIPSIFRHMSTSSLKHVSLKCGAGNVAHLQKFLNQLRLCTVSLDLWNISAEAVEMLSGLGSHAMQALDSLYIPMTYSQSVVDLLYNKRFFNKTRWTLAFYTKPSNGYMGRMTLQKTDKIFILQEKATTEPWGGPGVHLGMDTLMRVYQHNPPSYNYGFHRYGATNGFEILRPNLMFNRDLLEANWMRMDNFICGDCRNVPRLLCDLPGFREEANITFTDSPPCDIQHYNRAWTFYTVPQHVLAKWTQQLDLEIAAAQSARPCNCRCWDVVTKFGRAFPSSFPNPEEVEPEGPYNPWTDPTMESNGYSLTGPRPCRYSRCADLRFVQ